MSTYAALPCLICGIRLHNMDGRTDNNHPENGIEFVTWGHYGTTMFDPMDHSMLVINLCDSCLEGRARDGLVGWQVEYGAPVVGWLPEHEAAREANAES